MARRTLHAVILALLLLAATPRSLVAPVRTEAELDRPASEAPWWWGHRPGASQDATPTSRVVETIPPDPSFKPRARAARVWMGVASWYRFRAGVAAAGPELRAALGRHWRGRQLRVCSARACVDVVLADWCGCPGGRLIDLALPDFAVLGPLSRGLAEVTIFAR